MISNKDILKLENRREIYSFIEKNPGLHFREIFRKINISASVLRYHLDYLKKHNYITIETNQRFTRYYISNKICKKDKEILNLLREETPRKIILLLLVPGPGDVYISSEKMQNAIQNPATFSKTYSKKELIELTYHWNCPIEKHISLKICRQTINFHLKKLLDADLIEKIKVGREIKYRLKDDEIFWYSFFIKYKQTLSYGSVSHLLTWHDKVIKYFIPQRVEKTIFDIFPHPYHA